MKIWTTSHTLRKTKIQFAKKYIKRSVNNERLYYKANRVIDTIEEWCQGLGKNISLQRKERGLLVQEQLPSLQDPNEYLNSEEV